MGPEQTQPEPEEKFEIHNNSMDVCATGWNLLNTQKEAEELAQAVNTNLSSYRKPGHPARRVDEDGEYYWAPNDVEAQYHDGLTCVTVQGGNTLFQFDLTYGDEPLEEKLQNAAIFLCAAAHFSAGGQNLEALHISFRMTTYQTPTGQPNEGQEVQTLMTKVSRTVMKHTLWWRDDSQDFINGLEEGESFITVGIQALLPGPELPESDRLLEVMKAAYAVGAARFLGLMDPPGETAADLPNDNRRRTSQAQATQKDPRGRTVVKKVDFSRKDQINPFPKEPAEAVLPQPPQQHKAAQSGIPARKRRTVHRQGRSPDGMRTPTEALAGVALHVPVSTAPIQSPTAPIHASHASSAQGPQVR